MVQKSQTERVWKNDVDSMEDSKENQWISDRK